MTATKAQSKWTDAQVKEHIAKIQEAIEKHRRENKEEHFTAITPEEIEKKLKRVNSPMIVSQGWGSTTPGGAITYAVTIYNPDPTKAARLFVHVWVGSGHIDPTVGTFLLNVDTRFPRLTQPKDPGLSLAPVDSELLLFSLKVPSTVEKTCYIGNSCLMQVIPYDLGTYLDRSGFVFTVS